MSGSRTDSTHGSGSEPACDAITPQIRRNGTRRDTVVGAGGRLREPEQLAKAGGDRFVVMMQLRGRVATRMQG